MMNLPLRSSTCAPAGTAASAGSRSRMVFPSISSERSRSGASESPSMIVAPLMNSVEGACAWLLHAVARTPRTHSKVARPRADMVIESSSWLPVPLGDIESGVLLGEVNDASSVDQHVLDLRHEGAR